MFYRTLNPTIISLFSIVLTVLAACTSPGPRSVDNPWVEYSSTSTIAISKVDLTDSNTVLHVNARYTPNYWIKIAPESYLAADGKKYPLISADGIEPGKEFWMPESGEADFKLVFEPLPFSTEKFDFSEGDSEGAFRLGGINISGNPASKYPEGLPDSFKKEAEDGIVPDPVLEMGKTTVNLHLLASRPDFLPELSMFVNSIIDQQEEIPVKLDENGNATISFDQYGTVNLFVTDTQMGLLYADITLAPGETVDCYLDGRMSGIRAMLNSDRIYSRAMHNGRYNNFDRIKSAVGEHHDINVYGSDLADYHSTGEEYMNIIKSLYNKNAQVIQSADIPAMQKEYELLELQNTVLMAIADYRRILGRNYRQTKNDWRTPVPDDSIPARLDEKDFAEVTTWFDVSNPKLLMAGSSLVATDWNSHGAKGDLSKSLTLYGSMAAKAQKGILEPADIDSLNTLSNPFFSIACDSINRRAIRRYERLKQNATVTPTPAVADDKVFDAIISPHKGKVVVVDLWNTWCGPCRGALRENEPLKEGALNSDDIVWIYIADDSSDPVKYLEMIPDIKGIHYKVTENQIKSIRNRFNVDGIPYYILVDRDGNAEGRPDLRDHSQYIKTIKSKL